MFCFLLFFFFFFVVVVVVVVLLSFFYTNHAYNVCMYVHSREIKTLHCFNGKYMGNCLKYKLETMGHRVFKKRLGIQQNIL